MKTLILSLIVSIGFTTQLTAEDAAAPAIIIDELTQVEKQEVVDQFNVLNSDWQQPTVRVSNYAPYIHYASRQVAGELSEGSEAIQTAKAFVEKNADLLGVELSDLSRLEYKKTGGIIGNVSVESRQPIRYEGFWGSPEFSYRIKLTLQVRDEKVSYVLNKTDRIAPLPILKQNPEMAAFADQIIDAMVDREMFYANFAGQQQSAGRITDLDIEPLGLAMEPIYQTDGLRVGLAWKYRITLGGLPWTFYFNAFDGSLIVVRQGFAT